VDFVDFLAGTMFSKIMLWERHSAIPVDDVDFLTGTDSSLPFPVLAAVCISYPVPNSCKSCQQDPISTVFVENVGVLPGTVNKVTFCCGLWGYLTWYLQSSNHALSALKAHFLWKMWMFYLVPIIRPSGFGSIRTYF